jgi:hypothetical protein
MLFNLLCWLSVRINYIPRSKRLSLVIEILHLIALVTKSIVKKLTLLMLAYIQND